MLHTSKKRLSGFAIGLSTAAILALTGCTNGDGSSYTYTNYNGDNYIFNSSGETSTTSSSTTSTTDTTTTTASTTDTTTPTTDTTIVQAASISYLEGDITQDTTLTNDTAWKLRGLVKVRPGVTLTIEPGTIILGGDETVLSNLSTRALTTSDTKDYLVIMKGAKIVADATPEKPIIFTSTIAYTDPTKADTGQWGGLTILGNAPTNHINPHYEVDENDPDFAFGGTEANDSSGILRNVKILNSGQAVATDIEINGLSLAGVGAGTVIENITVENSSDDCVEIWGGTVNVTNLELKNCQDDSLDLDYGYVGIAKHIHVTQVSPAHAGFEISSGGTNPMTSPKIMDFTIQKVNGSDEGGIYIKDDTTAPIFGYGTITTEGTDAAIHTKTLFTPEQKAAIAFEAVRLNAAVKFDGNGQADVAERYNADDGDQQIVKTLSGDLTTDTHLTADTYWKIDGLVKVRPGVTLTIDPDTTIFGDNIGDDYIVVMKGAKIIAEGTESQPIIFTSETALKDPNAADVGQWGGLTILGGAPTNHANPHYEVNENDPDFAFGTATAGEGNATESSGIIRYVHILNSGKTVGTDIEINGLSLAGVGSGTVIDNILVKNSSDDCVEIWGGTVNVSNLQLVNCQDDSLDLDYGYSGMVNHVAVTQVAPAHAGFEISSGGNNPMTQAIIKNFTINKVAGSDEGGIYIKDDTTAPIFIDGTVNVDTTDVAIHTKLPASTEQINAIGFKNVNLTPATFDGAAANDIQLRWEANDGAIPIDTTTLVGDITSDLTLHKTRIYKIDGLVKVRPGATLTIEPGTTIFGDNQGDDYIVVMKGAKIIADGTAEEPIIFTSEIALNDPTQADVGQWGGLTILGSAPTNHANPHYEVNENDPDFAFGSLNAGEGDSNDNSGILRHVKILNSGKTIGTDIEINGLSLAGVGAGTIVDNITVENSSDDCVEIWGGTVNVSNLNLTNCQDDSLDLDYGYSGTASYVTVTQVAPAHAGFEISSGGNNPMTHARIENFTINKVAGSDEGGIYIKDDTTAPIFINGVVHVDTTDVAIHTKLPATAEQKAAIAFKDVTLSPETFDGAAADDIKARWLANDAQ